MDLIGSNDFRRLMVNTSYTGTVTFLNEIQIVNDITVEIKKRLLSTIIFQAPQPLSFTLMQMLTGSLLVWLYSENRHSGNNRNI
jgi:hypothetical protein